MITNELLAFVKEELSKGTSQDEIRAALVEGGGWSDADVKEAFDAVGIYSNTFQGTIAKAALGRDTFSSKTSGAMSEPGMGISPSGVQPAMQSGMIQHGSISPPMGVVSTIPATVPHQGVSTLGTMRDRLGAESMRSNPAPVSSLASKTMTMSDLSISNERAAPAFQHSPEQAASVSIPKDMSPSLKLPGVMDAFAQAHAPTGGTSPSSTPPFSGALNPTQGFSSLPSLSSQPNMHPTVSFGSSPSQALAPQISRSSSPSSSPRRGGHGFLYFIIILIFILAILLGAAFAYLKGLFPSSLSFPLLDDLNKRFSLVSNMPSPADESKSLSDNAGGGSGLEFNDPSLVPAPVAPAAPSPVLPEAPRAGYYTDRVKLVLPTGSPVSATTIASSVALEYRGIIAECNFGQTENSCLFMIPAKSGSDFESIVKELKKDSRLKDALLVAKE